MWKEIEHCPIWMIVQCVLCTPNSTKLCALHSLNSNHHKELHRSPSSGPKQSDSNQRALKHSNDKNVRVLNLFGIHMKRSYLLQYFITYLCMYSCTVRYVYGHIVHAMRVCLCTARARARASVYDRVCSVICGHSHIIHKRQNMYTQRTPLHFYIYVINMSSNLLAMLHVESHSQQFDGGFKSDHIYLCIVFHLLAFLSLFLSWHICFR